MESCVFQNQYCSVDDIKMEEEDGQQPMVIKEEILDECDSNLDQKDPELLNIKEDEEKDWISQEEEMFDGQNKSDTSGLFFSAAVKTEDDEEEPQPSQLQQIKTEDNSETEPPSTNSAIRNKTEPGGDCGGPEQVGNPAPNGYSESDGQQLMEMKEEVSDEWDSTLAQKDPQLDLKKEEEKIWISQEEEQLNGKEKTDTNQFLFSVTVKSEDDEEKAQFLQLHQIKTNDRETEPPTKNSTTQTKAEPDEEDCGGPEPAENPEANDYSESNADDFPSDSSETDDDDDWNEHLSGLESESDDVDHHVRKTRAPRSGVKGKVPDGQQLVEMKEEVSDERDSTLAQKDPQLDLKKEEEKIWISQEEEQFNGKEKTDTNQFLFSVTVKSEDDEEKAQFLQLHQIKTNDRETEPPTKNSTTQTKAEPDEEDCGGPEPAENPEANDYSESNADDLPSDSSETDDNDEHLSGLESESDDVDHHVRKTRAPRSGVKGKVPGEKPFNCDLCEARFSRQGTLKRHYQKVHKK
ncbi:cilia- and flagella-associated protein 251-like [Melanotaenia boesemani]|uniref:cilia- and flagella-associated protein 251-like n=1 Tax=Melanotaenia boesemani TaxID=1250792 RepID=UPI001C05962B|nr:cilia- and flagella-associated protein 251-like [Melanotaenia boesemani]